MLKYYKAEIYERYISICKDSVFFREIQVRCSYFSIKNSNSNDPVKKLKTIIKGSRCTPILVTFGRVTSQSSKIFPEMVGCLGRSSKKLCKKI